MREEQNVGKDAFNFIQHAPKRRRAPSEYASQIADFKNVILSTFRTILVNAKLTETSSLRILLSMVSS